MTLYKYSGAGNDFVVLDGRGHDDGELSQYRSASGIAALCDRKSGFRAADGRIGADGLMILTASVEHDFRMEYYNSDGSGGMMCGNGGRCIVAFAAYLGIVPRGKEYVFEAADGLHTGEILSGDGSMGIVRIGMIDAFGLRETLGGWFLNTGTRHFVKFVEDVDAVDIAKEGARYRWDADFAPEGTNANFVQVLADGLLKVRTFEKGVEAETLACGTGLTACAIAAYYSGISACSVEGAGASSGSASDSVCPVSGSCNRIHYDLHARIDNLSVDFIPASPAASVYLTGPAKLVK